MSCFTYFGDLVGIKSLYATSPKQAYERLNEYYNTAFYGLTSYYDNHPDRKVEMYSDSIVVTGDSPELFIENLACVYVTLHGHGLFLRGGLVPGRLEWDVRIQADNYRKNLPKSDVLAQAVSLEQKVKGSRFIVHNEIAHQLLSCCPEWITLDGYARTPKIGDPDLRLQRSLIPLPDGSAYEVLYPVVASTEHANIERRISELNYMIAALPQEISVHHTETKRLYEHSRIRLAHQKGNEE
jgi:hypothetical protein